MRLAHNTVAGADEMVVYETPWSRWRAVGSLPGCPGRGRVAPRGAAPAEIDRDRIIGVVESMRGLGRALAARSGPGGVPSWARATAASAQMYRWTDERGEVHYSQGIDSVPPRFRGGRS